MCEERGEKLLVFSQSLLSLDLIEEFLAQCTTLVNTGLPSPAGRGKWEKNVDYFRMDGATSGMKRHEFIGRFVLTFQAKIIFETFSGKSDFETNFAKLNLQIFHSVSTKLQIFAPGCL